MTWLAIYAGSVAAMVLLLLVRSGLPRNSVDQVVFAGLCFFSPLLLPVVAIVAVHEWQEKRRKDQSSP